jgi:predicted DNA-binding transcriptional regulator AlpA
MRLDRAAAYLGMGSTLFLELVEQKVLPKPTRIRGMVVWDRLDLDAAFENLKGLGNDYEPRENTVDRLLGIKSGGS